MQSVNLKPFVCSECGKGYSRNYCLQKHLEEEHHACTIKQQKRFHCPMCDQETGSFYTLLEMRKHCIEEHQNILGIYIQACAYINIYIVTYICTYIHTAFHDVIFYDVMLKSHGFG